MHKLQRAPAMASTHEPQEAGLVESVRVVTLNLNIDLPCGAASDAVVRHAITEEQPDIICFQEALWIAHGTHQAMSILAGFGYHIVHQFDVQPRPDRNPGGQQYGTVIASRWPIAHSEVVPLPSTERGAGFPRALQAAEITAPPPVGRLLIVNPKVGDTAVTACHRLAVTYMKMLRCKLP